MEKKIAATNLWVCLLVSLSFVAKSQTPKPLINSGEILKLGVKLHDEQKYKEAIAEYKKVSRSDTNYAIILQELAMSYYLDSNFDASIQAANEGLQRFPELASKWYGRLADAEDDKGNWQTALDYYNKIITLNPQDYLGYFNKAVCLFRQKKYSDAKTNFQQCILINPYYSSAHNFLGRICIEEGKPVQALLSLCTSLLANPDGRYFSNNISLLSKISNATDEVTSKLITGSSSEDDFELLQEVLLSKASFDGKYKLKSSLEDKIVRQIQVVMEKLEYNATDKGFWMQYYVPLFKEIFAKDFELFTYYIFSSIDDKTIQGFIKKNKKAIDKFGDTYTIPYLNNIRQTRELNFTKREAIKERFYTSNNIVFAKGTEQLVGKEYTFIGNVEYYYDNGQLRSKGKFDDKGLKDGEWKFYHNNGQLKELSTFKEDKAENLAETWFNNGVKSGSTLYKGNVAEGAFTTYFFTGAVKRKGKYVNDEYDGELLTFSSSEYLEEKAMYKEGKLNGPAKVFFNNGNVKIATNFSNDLRTGNHKEFFYSGKLYAEGNFENGKKIGAWKLYFESGKLYCINNYENGELEGEQTYYFENGKVQKKDTYVKGKIEGTIQEFDDDGKLFCETQFEKGRLREIKFYNKKGEMYSNTTSRKGDATLTFFDEEGNKTSEGYFTRDGFRSGKTTFYYTSGKIKTEEEYKNGELNGLQTKYFKNGNISSTQNYKNDQADGYLFDYHSNKQVYEEGWIIEGQKQGMFYKYDAKGALKSTINYLNNDEHGFVEYYHPNGKKDYEQQYFYGWLVGIKQFDTTGKTICDVSLKNGTSNFTFKHYNGNDYIKAGYKNGHFFGSYATYYCNGKLATQQYYKAGGYKDSIYLSYHLDGKIATTGSYSYSNKVGTWKSFYENGKPYTEEYFVLNEQHGISKTYNEIDGSLQREATFKNGVLDGPTKVYGENNLLAYQLNYKNGSLLSYTYTGKDGNLVAEIPFVNGTGNLVAYYKNGTKSAEINFIDYDIHGNRLLFFSSGKPYIVSSREFGSETGTRKVYYPNGQLESETQYYLNDAHGINREFYPTGKPKCEEFYYMDELHGECKYYNEQTGKLTIRKYYYGILQSIKE